MLLLRILHITDNFPADIQKIAMYLSRGIWNSSCASTTFFSVQGSRTRDASVKITTWRFSKFARGHFHTDSITSIYEPADVNLCSNIVLSTYLKKKRQEIKMR